MADFGTANGLNMKGKMSANTTAVETSEVRMELSGRDNPYYRDHLRATVVETVDADKLIADAVRGGWIYPVRYIVPVGKPSHKVLGLVVGTLDENNDGCLRQLWQIGEYLEQRLDIYCDYKSAGECPAILPEGEHEEAARRIAGIREKIERIEELFESGLRKRFPEIPVDQGGVKRIQIHLYSGWRVYYCYSANHRPL